MMFLLDTNILSELMKPAPSEDVVAWVRSRPVHSLFISAITQAEILYGIALLPAGRRKKQLAAAADSMFKEDFDTRILPFDASAAFEYSKLASARSKKGQPISQFDAQIAAIARSRGASIATRNEKDFVNCGVEILNPWKPG